MYPYGVDFKKTLLYIRCEPLGLDQKSTPRGLHHYSLNFTVAILLLLKIDDANAIPILFI